MKKLCLFFLLVLVSCDVSSDPKSVVEKYNSLRLEGKFGEVYDLLSSSDQKVETKASYAKRMQSDELAGLFQNQTRFKVTGANIKEIEAVVFVDVTMPDLSSLMGDVLSIGMVSAFSGDKKKANELLDKTIKEKLTGNVAKVTKSETFKLVKEQNEWKILLGWEAQSLLKKANDLRKKKRYTDAISEYQKALDLDSELAEAKKGIEQSRKALELAKKLKKERKKRKTYIKMIRLYDLKSGYYRGYLKDKFAGVTFKLKNNGNKTLSEVKVVVYFKNAAGDVIFEKDFTPVYENKYSSRPKLLKPNYVWQNPRGKYYTVDDMPSEWKEGSAFARIVDIKFKE